MTFLLCSYMSKVEIDGRTIKQKIGYHAPVEQRPPLYTGAQFRDPGYRGLRIGVLHDDDIGEI